MHHFHGFCRFGCSEDKNEACKLFSSWLMAWLLEWNDSDMYQQYFTLHLWTLRATQLYAKWMKNLPDLWALLYMLKFILPSWPYTWSSLLSKKLKHGSIIAFLQLRRYCGRSYRTLYVGHYIIPDIFSLAHTHTHTHIHTLTKTTDRHTKLNLLKLPKYPQR